MSKQWFETTVKIKVEGDGCTMTGGAPAKIKEIKIPAIGCRDVPGLVYHVRHQRSEEPRLPKSGDALRITHEGSGKFILPPLRTRKATREAILELGKLTDWTQDESVLLTPQDAERIRQIRRRLARRGDTA